MSMEKLTIEQKRCQALENLVMFYLKGNDLGTKELRGPVSKTNSFRIEFDKPPTQSEIEHLILILKSHQPILPESRDNRSASDIINETLAQADQAPLERRKVDI